MQTPLFIFTSEIMVLFKFQAGMLMMPYQHQILLHIWTKRSTISEEASISKIQENQTDYQASKPPEIKNLALFTSPKHHSSILLPNNWTFHPGDLSFFLWTPHSTYKSPHLLRTLVTFLAHCLQAISTTVLYPLTPTYHTLPRSVHSLHPSLILCTGKLLREQYTICCIHASM